MTATTKICFRNLVDREIKEREHLTLEKVRLDTRPSLTKEERDNLKRINDILKELGIVDGKYEIIPNPPTVFTKLIDPLYVVARDYFNSNSGLIGKTVGDHKEGVLQAQPTPVVAGGYDLRLMSVAAPDGLVNEGRNLVNVALVGTDLHIRIFDASGKKVVDKVEKELVSGETLTALKKRLTLIPDESGLSKEHKQKIIGDATSIAGHTLAGAAVAGAPPTLDFDDVVKISLVLGLLAVDAAPLPRVKVLVAGEIGTDLDDPANSHFSKAFFAAFGEAQGGAPLAKGVLSILEDEGDPAPGGKQGEVKTDEFAEVVRCLKDKDIKATEPQLKRRINECLDTIQSVGIDKPLSDSPIELPDLNDATDFQIQAENVKLIGVPICGAMFEELKVFQVVDKLVEFSQNGMLPVSRGDAGEILYHYWKETPNRMSEGERRNFYALTIGIPGGEANGMTNRDFNDLWMRFISSVSSLVRQKTADQILRANIPAAISQQQVRKAARDLALNLSSHAYGMSLYFAIEMQKQIRLMIQLLSDKEIMAVYGARDMWQVIDQVATLELGGARNSARYRTMATCGAIITAWLSNNVQRYNSATSRVVIDIHEVLSSDPATAGPKATTNPTDFDLVNACELWLADTGTSDMRVEELSESREAPMMTSKPVQIPSIAREMLEQAGIPGLGFGMGSRRQ